MVGVHMNYPEAIKVKVEKIFGDREVEITLYSGLTTFIGTNASGKTQTLKALKEYLAGKIGFNKVRYLSSNRIGDMEQYRSKANRFNYPEDRYELGDQETKKMRKQIETATGDFFAMDDRKDVYIKVSERLSVLFKRQVFIRWDAGKMKVFFGEIGSEREYSVAAEASGLINVISILAALYDEEIEVLLIDEPEVSLHPQLQSYLLREMKRSADRYNKSIIISTHSAEMIDLRTTDDLPSFVFFKNRGLPKQIAPDAPELNNNKFKDFFFQMNLTFHEGFFAKKILLLEGSSDLIISCYLGNRLELNLDVAGAQIIPVNGKGQFPVVVKLFRLIGKEVYVLTDLDGFTDDNSVVNLFAELPEAVKIANQCGNENLQAIIKNTKNGIEKLINTSKQEELKEIYENHPYWKNRDPGADEDKIRRRAIIASLLSANEEVLIGWPRRDEWEGLKTRITALLDLLEKLGCFVLRKGAIESYYCCVPDVVSKGKPSAAAAEVEKLEKKDKEEICQRYADVIRALKFAALDETVDESFAVKKELLSELALILGILKDGSTENELMSEIKRSKGSAESLFNYSIIRENDQQGVEVSLKSPIIDVEGFPFKAFVGDNVNQIVDMKVHSKL